MSVYTIDKCERFVSQRAGCGKAARPVPWRGASCKRCVYSTLVLNELERARMQVVLEYLNGNKKINSAIAAELLGVEVKTASRLLSKAEKLEILKGDGKTKNKVYSVL